MPLEPEVLARERRQATRRPGAAPVPEHQLARGPGCLGQALALGITDSGAVLQQCGGGTTALAGDGFVLLDGEPVARTSSGPRVGVSRAADRPWRFWATGHPSVSSYARSRRAPADGAKL